VARVVDATTERLANRVVNSLDELVDFLVVAFAAWTAIYHAALIFHLGSGFAAIAGAVALLAAVWPAFFLGNTRLSDAGRPSPAGTGRSIWFWRFVVVNVVVAVIAALLFAFTVVSWRVVWPLWVVAAGCGFAAVTKQLLVGRASGPSGTEPRIAPVSDPVALSTAVAFLWAACLSVLSLFVVDPDGDDTQYVHLASWVSSHGEFPLRDTIFSDQRFPAIIYPPISSLEALVGTFARITGLQVADLTYLVVTPLATAFAVFALWRLLRAWQARPLAVALSAAVLFLLFDATQHRTMGSFFLSRLWQGKVIFLAVLVPLLFVFLDEYVRSPSKRSALMLFAAGAAAVGLTSSALFVVPVVVLGSFVPLAVRSLRHAAFAAVAALAYPFAAAAATAVVGARNADLATEYELTPGALVHYVFGSGGMAFVAIAAALVASPLIRRPAAGAMSAGVVLLVSILFAPAVPRFVADVAGHAQALWRLAWALPLAALVGILATSAFRFSWPTAVRALPAVLLAVVFVTAGNPVWSARGPEETITVEARPAWKRSPESIDVARKAIAVARPGDTILGTRETSQSVLALSGDLTTVAPRSFYTRALRGVPGAQVRNRLLLMNFAEVGFSGHFPRVTRRNVKRALRTLSVDVVCIAEQHRAAARLLAEDGYVPAGNADDVECLRKQRP
jgi:hypothetical protein